MHSCGKQEKGEGGLPVLPATISHTCYCTSTTVPRTPLISAKQKYSSLFPKREALLERERAKQSKKLTEKKVLQKMDVYGEDPASSKIKLPSDRQPTAIDKVK